jgi:hypothetical protein
MASDELIALLVQVIQRPAELELRRRAAELLEQRGASAEALAVLSPLVNFTGHEAGDDAGGDAGGKSGAKLPCLCKTCLPTAGAAAEVDGVTFTRAFVVSGSRVLHFWLIDELADQRAEVKRAVGEALRGRLQRKNERGADGDSDGDSDDDSDD